MSHTKAWALAREIPDGDLRGALIDAYETLFDVASELHFDVDGRAIDAFGGLSCEAESARADSERLGDVESDLDSTRDLLNDVENALETDDDGVVSAVEALLKPPDTALAVVRSDEEVKQSREVRAQARAENTRLVTQNALLRRKVGELEFDLGIARARVADLTALEENHAHIVSLAKQIVGAAKRQELKPRAKAMRLVGGGKKQTTA